MGFLSGAPWDMGPILGGGQQVHESWSSVLGSQLPQTRRLQTRPTDARQACGSESRARLSAQGLTVLRAQVSWGCVLFSSGPGSPRLTSWGRTRFLLFPTWHLPQ